jgi:protein-S-isoprenylcysteine O-methyltransferase Ste14
VAGVAFAIWAREHLGKLWSGTITLKEGHRIVQSGPYRLARHPIYTGILTGVVGVVLARGDLASLLALVLFALGVARKIAIEEKLLGSRFGEEYAAYRKKVRAIIPFIL